MAKVFLDTNCFIDAVHRSPEKQILHSLKDHIVYVSPLSFHIYCYIFKISIPDKRLLLQKEKFQFVEFSSETLENSLNGPTKDFEDNVQLHSAAVAQCNIFFTEDKKLLGLKFFGLTRIASSLDEAA